jgi:hypothetical protein
VRIRIHVLIACAAAVLCDLADLAAPRLARAQPAAVAADVRAVDGQGSVDAMRLGLLAAGARWRVAPTLDVQVLALGLGTSGTADLGAPARGGFGVELGARILPWPRWPVRPYAVASLGGLLFLGEPFLPGGDFYEAIITFGAGAEIPLAERYAAALHVFSVHLSNGQGLGPFNPAYDGYGATLGVSYRLAPDAAPLAAAGARAQAPPRDVVVDAAIGVAGDAFLYSARARPSLRLSRSATVALDVEAGALAGAAFVEAALDLAGRIGEPSGGLALAGGVHGGYRRYAGIDVAVVTVQAELRATPELELVAMAHHERSSATDPLWRAGVGMRLTPAEALVIELGVGFDRLGDHTVFGDDHSDPYAGVEWRSPWSAGAHRLAVFLERQISTLDIVGIRWTTAAPAWRRLR